MDSTVNLVFPHQLFEKSPLPERSSSFVMVEEFLFFKQFKFHKQKLAYHRATMQFYRDFLEQKGNSVTYIEHHQESADIRNLVVKLSHAGVTRINYIELVDDWLDKRFKRTAAANGIEAVCCPTPMFLGTMDEMAGFFRPGKKRFFHHDFYKGQRRRMGILIDQDQNPVGGAWSFDKDNRKKYPSGKKPPAVLQIETGGYWEEAVEYVKQHFPRNPGELPQTQNYPTDFQGSGKWLNDFLRARFIEFGDYEDAIVAHESILNHSVLTPMLNTGLLQPADVVEAALQYSELNQVPINSVEGFIRQIIGWREFIRGIYVIGGAAERSRNFWGFSRRIPVSFYDGSTGIEPVDHTIKKVLATGYCHHIERLMILGNFMLLCEFNPDDVYQWFMELFIDAYDWVMVPNVYGMSQFADGGMMSTKPYLSGSNYILKMSDYSRGPWCEIWDGLFWRFMHVHRDILSNNPRLRMLLATLDRMKADTRNAHFAKADEFISDL